MIHATQPVTVLEMSVRTNNILERIGIETVRDLVEKTEGDLLEYKDFGRTQLNEVRDSLTHTHLTLGTKMANLDYVTDVDGNHLLENRTISCFILDNKVFVTIKMLGFCGSPAELLREHGMIYYSEGENTLRVQERLDRRARLKLDLGK